MTGTELATRAAEAAADTSLDLIPVLPKMPWMMRIEEHPGGRRCRSCG